jgi:hypothetical protein
VKNVKMVLYGSDGCAIMVCLQIAEIYADLALRAEIPSVFVLEKISSFPQRFGQIRTESWQDF